uniref:F-box and WD repeat domain containing 12 n=1 Tax=Propithecus coquereli TaxID=379532 RepID=A0A2K6GUB1_PROCO
MEVQLPDLPVALIFSFLDAFSLLQVSQVNKCWNRIADSDHLWRTLCLKRWGFCNFTSKSLGTQSWKQFFLRQTKEERRMALAQPDDFTCKEVTPDLEIFEEVAYLSGHGLTMDGQKKSIVCVVSSKHTLDTWDVQEVGDSEGDIYTFAVPGLKIISKVKAFHHSVDLLHCSPDKKWVFACGIQQYVLPKAFLTESLLKPSEGSFPVSLGLPCVSCYRACWIPRKESRITLMFRKGTTKTTGFTTFDLATESTEGQTVIQAHQIGSFLLPVHVQSPLWMGAGAENLIVFASGPSLFLFTINGLLLLQFQDHQKTIDNLWVDSLHVLTTSLDDSLHMYMWEEEGRYPYLKSCCHLGHMQHDLHHTRPGCLHISKAICDNVSIVHVVSTCGKFSNLVMYSLHM